MFFTPFQGYRVRLVSKLSENEPRHRFCGVQSFIGAECPNCNRALHAFITLDTTDSRLGLPSNIFGPSLPLLWCWACPVAQAAFIYSVKGGVVTLLRCRKGSRTSDFPYENYPDFFPLSDVRLLPISSRTAQLIKAVNEGADTYPWRYRRASTPCHQVGGIPYILQGTDYQDGDKDLLCPTCHQRMSLLATIGDRCLDPRGICGNTYVQVLFHLCSHHGTIAAIQQCD
jgi:hypothetical protein